MSSIDLSLPGKKNERGKGFARVSLIIGFAALAASPTGAHAFIGLILGGFGVLFSAIAKGMGNNGAARTAGYVLSLMAIIIGALVFAVCGVFGGKADFLF